MSFLFQRIWGIPIRIVLSIGLILVALVLLGVIWLWKAVGRGN
jgi:hypothetical protein